MFRDADGGHPEANFYLAMLYFSGDDTIGVAPDEDKMWYVSCVCAMGWTGGRVCVRNFGGVAMS